MSDPVVRLNAALEGRGPRTEFLEAQFEAHQVLAQLFTPSASVVLTPEQLRTLRSLGYIR